MPVKYLYIATVFLFFLNLTAAQEKTLAVVKSYSGEVEIRMAGQPLETRQYLPLTEGAEVEVKADSSVTLFLLNGKKLTFTGGALFRLEEGVVVPVNSRARAELEESRTIYSRKDTLGSRSVTTQELPQDLVEKLELVELSIDDEALQALLKGELYREYGFKQLAAREFKLHKKLLKEQIEEHDSKSGASSKN